MPESADLIASHLFRRLDREPSDGGTVQIVRPELSVVVPVYDEAESITPLNAEIMTALTGVTPFEIVYVDDGSAGDTPNALAAVAQHAPMLRVLRHECRTGQSTALRTGVLATRGRWIATLDGDGQNAPADIPVLLARACAVARERDDDDVLIASWRTPRRPVAGWRRRRCLASFSAID